MTILSKLIFASLAGIAVLFIAILPAEYGIDPTGIGTKLGLTAMASSAAQNGPGAQRSSIDIEDYDQTADVIETSIKGLIHLEPAPFQTEIIDISIEDFGELEYKFVMPMDASIVYSWSVLNPCGDGVYYDFHGHPASADAKAYPDAFEMAYARGEATKHHGTFTAPFSGYHGFYFMNIEEGPIVVRLKVSGYWRDHKEMYRAVKGQVVKNEAF